MNCSLLAIAVSSPAAQKLPARLADQEFWKLSSVFSEPGGTFHSENLVSNELRFQAIIPALAQSAVPGRAYIGVGSEQNFSYIAASRPAIAFIIDLRSGNRNLHLIYKALFELSADRLEFVSRLFSRVKPTNVTTKSPVPQIFAAYQRAAASQALYSQNLKEIKSLLATKHGFKLSQADLDAIDFIYSTWFRYGPDLRYQLNGGSGPGFPTYFQLMTLPDANGQNRSYLAGEDSFAFLKDLHSRNMIVPVVGNFAGPKAIRAVGAYLKQNGVLVSVFYTSNVEQYLRQDGVWDTFCASAATLPNDGKSLFVRALRAGFPGQPPVMGASGNFNFQTVPMSRDLARCAK